MMREDPDTGGGREPIPEEPVVEEPVAPEEPPAEDEPAPELPPLPPPPPSTPLAVSGSFARPGTEEAVPFRTEAFLRDRLVGGDDAARRARLRFGMGAGIAGMKGAPVPTETSGPEGGGMDEDLIRALLSARGR